MKKKTTSQRLASLISRYENGVVIQKKPQNTIDAEWEDTEFPEWNIALFDYREKPKPVKTKIRGFIIKDSNREGNNIVVGRNISSNFDGDGAYSCELTILGVKPLRCNKEETK